jgi:hypothetical protein
MADPLDDKIAVRLQNALAMPAHLARSHRTSRTMTLRPLHNRGHRNAETRRYRPAALPGQNSCNNPLPKING